VSQGSKDNSNVDDGDDVSKGLLSSLLLRLRQVFLGIRFQLPYDYFNARTVRGRRQTSTMNPEGVLSLQRGFKYT
jgi:hypothetical protein